MKKIVTVAVLMAAGMAMAARPIAHWDVIPEQRIKGVFEVGVIAVGESPLKVEFSVNGKVRHTAETMSANPRTKVEEFVYPLDVTGFKAGRFELGARVLADGEEPLVLPNLALYADPDDSLGSRKVAWIDAKDGNDYSDGTEGHPVKTFKVALVRAGDGGTIYAKKGVYSGKRMGGGEHREYWTTITPAPGLKRADVKIEGGRIGADKIRFKGVELFSNASDASFTPVVIGEGGSTAAWFDGCKIYNRRGRMVGDTHPFGNHLVAYVTDGVTLELANGPSAALVRNHLVCKIRESAFSGGNLCVVNTRVKELGPAADDDATASHLYVAVAKMAKEHENTILKDLTVTDAKCSPFRVMHLKDSAFVNIDVTTEGGVPSKFGDDLENVIVRNVKVDGESVR